MEKEMTNEMFSHLKKIYRIVIFSFCLNVVCMMVLIWKLFIAQPDYTAFFSELRKVYEYTYQMAHPSPDLDDMPEALRQELDSKELYESSPRR
ncbi:hypothetical protein DWZ03_03605 [Bacteroides sp. AF29-11]|nr:hypothetical protein DWZ03_03605 [Bacteroides sp. AF29-11]